MSLLRLPEPFDHPDGIFEPKMDGFRTLAARRGKPLQLGQPLVDGTYPGASAPTHRSTIPFKKDSRSR